jgi:two-component system, chemotaxis family, chemotaxis protein CheY
MTTILVVDDSTSMRSAVAVTLWRHGYDVVEAQDGVAALQLARQRRFDTVLTDQNMPNMDGLTLVRALRSLAGYDDVPVLFLTIDSSEEMKQQGRSAGATGWIVKPFDPNRLVEVIKKVLH